MKFGCTTVSNGPRALSGADKPALKTR
jgi:hypothetical protein